MIWVGGRIVPDDALKISVLDRTFEHGLGLFETLRTWEGHPTLLDRHLARLTRSAGELGLPLDPAMLPDAGAVAALLGAGEVPGDALVRITLSGGVSDSAGSTLWMRAGPLPPPVGERGAAIELFGWQVAGLDPLARYKSLNYWGRRIAYNAVKEPGWADESLSFTPDFSLWEGSRTNVFAVKDEALVTPGLTGPIVPGVMRSLVVETARRLGLGVVERPLRLRDIVGADEVFLTNSVRGMIAAGEAPPGRTRWTEWPLTRRLWGEILPWLNRGGTTP